VRIAKEMLALARMRNSCQRGGIQQEGNFGNSRVEKSKGSRALKFKVLVPLVSLIHKDYFREEFPNISKKCVTILFC